MAAPDPRDPRYRPYRALMWGLYLVLTVAFALAITINVVRSTLAMTPDVPKGSAQLLGPEECLGAARALWLELDDRRKNSLADPPDGGSVRRVDADWTRFRIQWLLRHNQIAARCAGEGPERAALKGTFAHLDKLMDLYTTHAVQFAGEVGPTLDALRADLRGATPK